MEIAPVVLFVYRRPWHTRQTVEALQENELAELSDLYIFSDGTKGDEDAEGVHEVRQLVDKLAVFKSVTVVKRKENWGLATSVISGVTEVLEQRGRAIILEDDIVTGPYFLKFMNDALDFYASIERVWHISGWNFPIDAAGLGDAFLWRGMECWGWATWSDRWRYFQKDNDMLFREFSDDDIRRINLDGYNNVWSQVVSNAEGKIDTWAVYWYATLFQHHGLSLNPAKTHVRNIGFDGTGVHGDIVAGYGSPLSEVREYRFPREISENSLAVNRIKRFLRPHLAARLLRRIRSGMGMPT